jgi:hypothetical protein
VKPTGIMTRHPLDSHMKMYHAAPVEARQSILQNGLDHRIHFGNAPLPVSDEEVNWAERGNYLDESLKSAQQYGKERFPHGFDVWEVDVSGLNLKADEAWYKGWYVVEPIPSHRLTLLQTPA